MGKAIVVGITIIMLAVIVATVTIWWRRRDMNQLAAEKGTKLKGDLGPKEERQLLNMLTAADDVFDAIKRSCDAGGFHVHEISLLTPQLHAMINDWRKKYNEMKGRM